MDLQLFHPATAQWFADAIGTPTRAQRAGWAAIRERRHTLVAAPTGSGKTLAAFLIALDDLLREGQSQPLPDEVRVVYISPLKALSTDIHKNLEAPREGIVRLAAQMGQAAPQITAAVRTGDTSPAARAATLRRPPHILVTTPESLYLLLTSERSRQMLRTVRTVIVDEIHAVIGSRRGAHLALTLERLQQVAAQPLVRIGLSATQKPIDEVARFLVGAAYVDGECAIVDEGHRRDMDLDLELPKSPLEAVMSHEVWNEYYDRLTALIAGHKTTLVFVNTRRLAERVTRHLTERLGDAAVTAHHGSLSKERRLDAEMRLKAGSLRALVATASLELGIDIGSVNLVCQIGSPRRIATLLQRVGRSGHAVAGTPKGRVFPTTRDDLVECIALLRSVRRGELDRILTQEAPLDVLCQQLTAETACDDYDEDALYALVRRAWPYRDLPRADFDAVVAMAADGFATRRGRRAALLHRDEVHRRLRARRGARLLALTSGGAIPEVADYRVVLDPDDTFVGTLNEDFAIESAGGDVFQLGNASWRVLQVAGGTVRVADAHGAPPTIPFWLGEAPARSDELSSSVSAFREDIDARSGLDEAMQRSAIRDEAGVTDEAAAQTLSYLLEAKGALGALPSQNTLVLERFFDESGGMQLVLHSPFGSRINRAWGLALRKRFCRQFNFELQAAATDNALLLSLGPQHSFPLADVFRYLHPASARDVLIQAFLDAPVFPTRWRWNTTVALAVPRFRGGKKVPPALQRMLADDLMAAVFPDAAACLENIPGDRQIPDHPLVKQTVRDCLQEAMDFAGLAAVLTRIHAGQIRLIARDLPEPSVLAHEVLNAQPYAFLDDAPLEERRSHAVQTRRAFEPGAADDVGALDPEAIARVRGEARPQPRDADECHDALVSSGFLTDGELASGAGSDFASLVATDRAGRARLAGDVELLVAAERLPELFAIHPAATITPAVTAPPSRARRAWTRADACVELLRDRLSILGPVTAADLALSLAVGVPEVDEALLTLEGEGVVLRGAFTGPGGREWCDRRLLARIHRYTVTRLRAEIEPVSPADFMRFLFAWQHVAPADRLNGIDGLRAVLARLDGVSIAAAAWERDVLPIRVQGYQPSQLDTLCLAGEISWARRSSGDAAAPTRVVAQTPIALCTRDHADVWLASEMAVDAAGLSPIAIRVRDLLQARGASFLRDLSAAVGADPGELQSALGELIAVGLVTSDGFAGLRSLLRPRAGRDNAAARDGAGRWSLLQHEAPADRDRALDVVARALLQRYGVVFRRLLVHEGVDAPWRDLLRVFWRLEARGEVRGGRFVTGVSGEQFALADAVTRMREIRRQRADGTVIVIAACDPLNLTGVVDAGERIRVSSGTRIAYRDGVPAAALEGEFMKPLTALEPSVAAVVAGQLTGRRPIDVTSGFVGRARRELAH